MYLFRRRFVLKLTFFDSCFGNSSANWISTFSVSTTTIYTDCSERDEGNEDEPTALFYCEASFLVVSDDEYGGYIYASVSALLAVGALAYFVARRKRRAIDLAEEDRGGSDGHFEMLPDQGVKA